MSFIIFLEDDSKIELPNCSKILAERISPNGQMQAHFSEEFPGEGNITITKTYSLPFRAIKSFLRVEKDPADSQYEAVDTTED